MTEGVVIDQRFTIGRKIRESELARVYEAKHRNGADAWIAVPRAPEYAPALAAAAKVANALGAHAVPVRDDGVAENGLPFIVLEPVSGQRVDHWVQHCGGRAPADEAMGLGDELCQAIAMMNRAGFSLGILRAESIIVVPRGGMCLVELEHAVPATDETKLQDIALVGRVLYEMLAGRAFDPAAPALNSVAAELPRAMTMTVDRAARNGYASIDELRSALVTSIPQWLGPVRRPMPSMSADVEAPIEFSEIVLPRSSKSLFGLAMLDESSQPEVVAKPVAPTTSSADDVWKTEPQLEPTRLSNTVADAPPTVTADRVALPPPPRAGAHPLVMAAVIGSVAALATIAVIVVVAQKKASSQSIAAARAAIASSVAASPMSPAPVAKVAERGVVAPAATSAVLEIASAAPVASAAPIVSAAPAASAASVNTDKGETTFRFDGDLSPRLVIVDNITIGTTQKSVRYRCGWRTVKIGGKGLARSIELPCGGEETIVIESNGTWNAR